MSSELRGAEYVAQVPLYTRAGEVVAQVGETCERVAPGSLPWLLRDGHIVPRPETPDADTQEGR